ncbi:MAG: alpha/beta hydrolase [Eubacterium sp.]
MNINVNHVDLYYKKTGEGSPLILLHGNGEDHCIFDAIAMKLKKTFTVYAIDSRNHGQSQKTEDYSYAAMAEDIKCFIQKMNLGKADIIGFSDGAIIALMLAMKHENLVRKMALLGVNLTPDDFTKESFQFIKDTYETTKDPLFKMMLEQPNIDLESVKTVAIPTLIVGGENDIFKPETFQNLEAALPNAALKIMPGCGHDDYIVGKDILYDDLKEFLEK